SLAPRLLRRRLVSLPRLLLGLLHLLLGLLRLRFCRTGTRLGGGRLAGALRHFLQLAHQIAGLTGQVGLASLLLGTLGGGVVCQRLELLVESILPLRQSPRRLQGVGGFVLRPAARRLAKLLRQLLHLLGGLFAGRRGLV